MDVTCTTCGKRYDDADRLTYCPHDLIMPAEDLARKKAALALIDKRIRLMAGGIETRVTTVHHNGYVEVADYTGLFPPHLFVVLDAPETVH